MEYKDFIKPGNKAIHVPTRQDESLWWYDPEVVTIGEYKPYYTDGTPDPKPDEYEDSCYVEIEGFTKWDESQIRLGSLLPIVEESKNVVYDGCEYETYGHDEDDEYFVLKTDDGLKVVDFFDIEEVREIDQLSYDELVKLRKEICVGSIYLSDYKNSLGVTMNEVSGVAESYDLHLEEDGDIKDTPEEFARYVCDMYGISY